MASLRFGIWHVRCSSQRTKSKSSTRTLKSLIVQSSMLQTGTGQRAIVVAGGGGLALLVEGGGG
jgi:hypothetical protein